jgi:periplasmic protein TonB
MRFECLTPFSLHSARVLPVTGAEHPLRREYQHWMSLGNGATMLLVLIALGAYLSLQREPVLPKAPEVKIIIDNGPPASIFKHPTPSFTDLAPQPKLGIPEPVPNLDLENSSFPTQEEWSKALGQIDVPTMVGDGNAPIEVREPELPAPDVFVPVEKLPSVLRMDAPIYPPLAREAGVEGTVLLRVLVSREGKVLNALVISGNQMLADAALTAARTAVFSPALQQQKPVAVWVQMPIVFSLK